MTANTWTRSLTALCATIASVSTAAHGYHPPDPSPLWTLLHPVSQPDYLAVIVLVVLLALLWRRRAP